MPLKSEAQRRFLHAAEARGQVPAGLAHEFEHATPAAKKARLPYHVKKHATVRDLMKDAAPKNFVYPVQAHGRTDFKSMPNPSLEPKPSAVHAPQGAPKAALPPSPLADLPAGKVSANDLGDKTKFFSVGRGETPSAAMWTRDGGSKFGLAAKGGGGLRGLGALESAGSGKLRAQAKDPLRVSRPPEQGHSAMKTAERYEGVDGKGQMATNENEDISSAAGSAMFGAGKPKKARTKMRHATVRDLPKMAAEGLVTSGASKSSLGKSVTNLMPGKGFGASATPIILHPAGEGHAAFPGKSPSLPSSPFSAGSPVADRWGAAWHAATRPTSAEGAQVASHPVADRPKMILTHKGVEKTKGYPEEPENLLPRGTASASSPTSQKIRQQEVAPPSKQGHGSPKHASALDKIAGREDGFFFAKEAGHDDGMFLKAADFATDMGNAFQATAGKAQKFNTSMSQATRRPTPGKLNFGPGEGSTVKGHVPVQPPPFTPAPGTPGSPGYSGAFAKNPAPAPTTAAAAPPPAAPKPGYVQILGKQAEPNTMVDGADRTGRDYTTGPMAGARNAMFGIGKRVHGTSEAGGFDSSTASQVQGHGKACFGTPFRKHAAMPTMADLTGVGGSAVEGGRQIGHRAIEFGREAGGKLKEVGESAGEGVRQGLEYLKAHPMAAAGATGLAGLLALKGVTGLGRAALGRAVAKRSPSLLNRLGARLAAV